MNEEKIRGGVILIGSLYWEDEFNAIRNPKSVKLGKYRRLWREKNLAIDKTSVVELPVRYGRCSSGRNNTFTMVLSKEYLKKGGTGLVVSFKSSFDANRKQHITQQIKKLVKAEDISESKELSAVWGAIAIWINPKSSFRDQLEKYWKRIVDDKKSGYQGKSYSWADGNLLDINFRLQIEIDSELDFLLCTYILPKYKAGDRDTQANENMVQGYPNVEQISEAIRASKYSTYFCQNRSNNISTVDDLEIFKKMSKK